MTANIKDFVSFPYSDMKLKDFIGIWEKKVPHELCDKTIDYIESQPLDKNIGNDNALREDRSTFLIETKPEHKERFRELDDYLTPAATEYANTWGALKGAFLTNSEIKLQKTLPCQGYHVWHCERNAMQFVMRELVWTIYLNDMPDGEGETEFLFQKYRYQPQKGDIVIFPASFTHTHRGNPPYTRTKYIATGWYLYTPPGGIHIQETADKAGIPVTTLTDRDCYTTPGGIVQPDSDV